MEIQENIINKVANSGLITFDLASLEPRQELVVYDVKDNLFHGLILKEKDFRDFVKHHDWAQYTGKLVLITCTADAIVPTWAYMLIANRLAPYVDQAFFGNETNFKEIWYEKALLQLDLERFRDQRVVVKGCGDIKIPESAFVNLTLKLSAVAKSIMYGEPCSTVPIFKRKA